MDQTKGSFKIDEDAIREQVLQEYRDRLAYKDTEIESINNKLARISQSNIELKTKSDRLDAANQQLAIECEQNRNRVNTLEMELEMSRVNYEADTEKLIEQHNT